MDLILRPETAADYRASEELTRAAFWDIHVPGCTEHYILHTMRTHPDFIPELDYVAEADGRLVGQIAYTRATVMSPDGASRPVACFGPISVLPEYQGRGVGGALIRRTLELAKGLGYPGVVILGDPRYYHRHGFRSAEKWDITMADGKYAPTLMACPLSPGGLDGLAGRFLESPVFEQFDEAAFDAFDAGFPPREKGFQESQRDFAFLSTFRF